MKLYNMNLSNFATKSRLVVYEKGANVEIAPIPGGDIHSAEYLKINPLGKVPCLDVNGAIIPESELINEYLEEKFPAPGCDGSPASTTSISTRRCALSSASLIRKAVTKSWSTKS
jgi:glutathione S-transferase